MLGKFYNCAPYACCCRAHVSLRQGFRQGAFHATRRQYFACFTTLIGRNIGSTYDVAATRMRTTTAPALFHFFNTSRSILRGGGCPIIANSISRVPPTVRRGSMSSPLSVGP